MDSGTEGARYDVGRERELERQLRRLERERLFRRQPEQVECRQSGPLSPLSLFNNPVYGVVVFLCHPPSILPISTHLVERAMYFLLSRALISQAICKRNLRRSSEEDARLRYIPFCTGLL